ncbi:unnamed protein product [Ilex paraguariensis]|uniref:Uncharacterized protein n=1 Tax=Ilex paraguariensis TaxID=185542 RepID=A0ABC8TI92_9AQUA
MVGSEVAGRGGSDIFGMVGSGGIWVVGKGGNVGIGRVGTVGIAGSGGNVGLGRDGIVGSVGVEICRRWRAPRLIWMLESDKISVKDRMEQRYWEVIMRSGEHAQQAGYDFRIAPVGK